MLDYISSPLKPMFGGSENRVMRSVPVSGADQLVQDDLISES